MKEIWLTPSKTNESSMVKSTIPTLLEARRADTKLSWASPVLDLPQLYTRPSPAELRSTLDQLRIEPTSWDDRSIHELNHQESKHVRVNGDGVPKYLTGIISSSLSWIEDGNQREEIYEAAGARLAERSGRTGARYVLFSPCAFVYWLTSCSSANNYPYFQYLCTVS